MKKQLFNGVAFAALAISGSAMFAAPAFAQSTGTIDAEEGDAIIVTGSRTRTGINGIETPDTPKARTVLDNAYIRTQAPGQSILQTINIVPSVNFTNNDPFGSSGGNIRIRGFDGNRVSLTFDGLPLNDTGNYAIFSNQQLDPEIIDSVNVNQGTTDVDSPTAASSGGTINYRSLIPSEELGAVVVGSYGESYRTRSYNRFLGLIQTGDILGTGIRGFAAVSTTRADKFRGPGDLKKEQYNVKLYKGFDNGAFVALAGHYNRNRNYSFRTFNLAQSAFDYADDGQLNRDFNPLCARPTFVNGTAQSDATVSQPSTAFPTTLTSGNIPPASGNDNGCSNYAGVRLNPSNTGNIRFNSKFPITDKLTFTLDAGYQYVLATGGNYYQTRSEIDPQLRGFAPGVFTGGVDLSRDGDTLDTVALSASSITNTNRYTVLSSLRYEFNDEHSIRIAYAFDYGRHRQTGEFGFLTASGDPVYVFNGRLVGNQVFDRTGQLLRTRDRFSIAELNQISGEYRGEFFDGALEVLLGLRAPFFHRELNQYCYTNSGGNPICTNAALGTTPLVVPTQRPAGQPQLTAQELNFANYYYVVPASTPVASLPVNALYAPFATTYNYRKVLPNVGLTFRPTKEISLYASYAKGLSAPRTDNLYRAPRVNVAPETTDNFDAGIRYRSSMFQASLGGFYNKFQNRIVTSFDPESGISVDRNVGRVEIKGLEASFNVKPFRWFSFNGFGSYIDARYKDNLIVGRVTAAGVTTNVVALLAGKRLVETPEWQYGYSARFTFGPAELGATFKKVTKRYATDLNDQVVPGYSTFDLDGRVSLETFGLKKTFVQVNVNNLFDSQYLGSISTNPFLTTNNGQITGIAVGASTANFGGGTPVYTYGSPRSFVVSLQVGF